MATPELMQKSMRLAAVTLGATAAICLVLALLAGATAGGVGFPLANIVAVAALPTAVAIAAFWFADRQDVIDRQIGRRGDR